MTYEQAMNAARKAHAAGRPDHAQRLVRLAQAMNAPEQGPPMPSTAASAANEVGTGTKLATKFLQGVPFVGEFIDEGLGQVAARQSGLPQELVTDTVRESIKQVDEEMPVASTVAQGAGALTGSAPLAFVPGGMFTLGARSGLGKAATGGLTGGLLGGAESASSSYGRTGTENMMQDAAIGSALGIGLGVAAEPVTQAAGSFYRRIGPGAAKQARGIADSLGLNEIGANIVGRAAELDAPFAADNLARAGQYGVVAQTGKNTRQLLDWAMNRPGGSSAQVNAQVNEMAGQAGGQLKAALDNAFGAPQAASRTQQQIMTDTATDRAAAYAEAYEAPINYTEADTLKELLSRVPEDVLKKAERLMETEGRKRIVGENPDVRQIDYITRALRDSGDFGVGEGKEQGRAFTNLARQLRHAVDDLVPAYKTARGSGRDAIANREAVQFGYDAFRRTKDTTRAAIEDALMGMTPAEVGYVKSGARSYIDDIMARANAALTDSNMDAREALAPLKLFTSREGKDKLSAILGKEQSDKFAKEVDEVYAALSLRASTAENSKTQMRAMAEGILDDSVPLGFGEALAEGRGLSGALAETTRPYWAAGTPTRAGQKDQVAQGIAEALLKPGGGGNNIAALEMQRALAQRGIAQGRVEDLTSRGLFSAIPALAQQPNR